MLIKHLQHIKTLILCIAFYTNLAYAEIYVGPKVGLPFGLGMEAQITLDKTAIRIGVGRFPDPKGGRWYYNAPLILDYYVFSNTYDDCYISCSSGHNSSGSKLSLGLVFLLPIDFLSCFCGENVVGWPLEGIVTLFSES